MRWKQCNFVCDSPTIKDAALLWQHGVFAAEFVLPLEVFP
jgi:hypothetical protein